MSVLAIASGDLQSCKKLVTAGIQLGGELHLCLLGKQSMKGAYNKESTQQLTEELARIEGVGKLLHINPESQLATAEAQAAAVIQLADDYQQIITLANAYGKNFMPRVAAVCDRAMVSDLVQILEPGVFVRPIYAGNAMAEVVTEGNTCLTIRTTAFAAASQARALAAMSTIELPINAVAQKVEVIAQHLNQSDRPELTSARVVVSGGRGLGSKEAFDRLLTPLADKLGAAIGASRAAVDAGHVPNDCQIGQTGKMVAPDLYLAIGISGAVQHLAGMQNSRVIVAINKDPEAPVFALADYRLVGDLFTLVPELCSKL